MEKEIETWRAERLTELKKEGGWLSLVGLYWLKEGSSRIGSDPSTEVVLPKGAPTLAGMLTLGSAGALSFVPGPGSTAKIGGKEVAGPRELRSDREAGKGPDKVQVGTVTFWPIWRQGRLGVRVTDAEAEARKAFRGIEHWPVDPKWRVVARFEPYDPPKKIEVATVIPGLSDKLLVPGAAVFNLEGREYRLEPVVEPGDTDYFFVFADGTSGKESYGAGRFLYSAPAKDGKVVLDFNKAFNPPCAFTPFATCPLPPAQNRLPVRIESGEKKYERGH